MKIVVTGSIAFDYLMSFPGRFADNLIADQLHNISVSFLVDDMKRQRGGIAPNIAYTMALLGGSPTIMATAGQDFPEYKKILDDMGIDTSAIKIIDDIFTASFFVNTDLDQNQIASFFVGAMANASEVTFETHAADADLAIISPNEPNAMRFYCEECTRLGINYIYDPSQQTARASAEDLLIGIKGCTLLTVNEYELSMIQEKTGMNQEDILDSAGGLLITLAEKGAALYIDGDYHEIPAVAPKEMVEPTGAGDAFRAGLMRGIELGLPWSMAGRIGALSATYCLEQLGTQNHSFTAAEFVARFRENFDDEGQLDMLLGN
eukprot:jgi/Undpi1/12096/HiC_scaffold_40.g14069.m1